MHNEIKGLLSLKCGNGLVSGGLQSILQHQYDVWIVVNDENLCIHTSDVRCDGSNVKQRCCCMLVRTTPHCPPMTLMTSPVNGFG